MTAVAILGAAHVHARDHLALIERDPELTLAAASPAGDGTTIEFPPGLLVEDPAETARRGDVIVIDSPTDRHRGLVDVAVAARRPVFVEKPLAATAGEVQAIASVLTAAGVRFRTGFYLRRLPALREARRLLSEGRLGTLASVETSIGHDGLAEGVFTGAAAWMVDRGRAGVGALGDLGTHLIDLLLWLRPGSDLVVDACRLERDPAVAVEVGGTVDLRWDDDVPARIRAGWVEESGGFRLRLTGSSGVATVEDGGLEVDGSTMLAGPAPAAEEALAAFVSSLGRPASPEDPSLAGSLRVAGILDRAYAVDTEFRG